MHENPELGFEEIKTSDMIRRELDRPGVKWKSGFGKTGLCAIIEGGKGPSYCLTSRFRRLTDR